MHEHDAQCTMQNMHGGNPDYGSAGTEVPAPHRTEEIHTDDGIHTTDRPARCVPEVSRLETADGYYCCSTAMWGRLRYCSR
jgi:hypothetical protein